MVQSLPVACRTSSSPFASPGPSRWRSHYLPRHAGHFLVRHLAPSATAGGRHHRTALASDVVSLGGHVMQPMEKHTTRNRAGELLKHRLNHIDQLAIHIDGARNG